MSETPFYGRSDQLDRLNKLLKKKSSSLVIVKGRRGIGKSSLIEQFSKVYGEPLWLKQEARSIYGRVVHKSQVLRA